MAGICPLHKLQPNGCDRFQQNDYIDIYFVIIIQNII